MPIVVKPEEYIGQLLYLKPGYGWGWRGANDQTLIPDYGPIQASGGCHLRVQSFFSWRGEVRGVVGRVEQAGHLFDGLWVVCGSMLRGEWDFTGRLCLRYDLEFGPLEPDGGEWPSMAAGSRTYAGYGVLAETARHAEALSRQP